MAIDQPGRRAQRFSVANSDLEGTTFGELNWQKVQYKSTPVRLAAVWFRTEKGGQQLTSTQVANTLASSSPHSADDDPVALLSSDHPGFDFSTLDVVLEVIQFRYRVEFRDPVTGNPIFELSMDKIVTTVPEQPSGRTYGVELEVLQSADSRVEELLSLMLTMEAEFGLTRAITSKSGISVSDSALPVMRLGETMLDYRQVELGFAFKKAIVIHNDGYAPLVVSVTDQSTSDPDRVQWSELNEVINGTVPAGGGPLLVPQVYEPGALGSHDIQFNVTSNDPGNETTTVILTGEGISPVPIDSVLVLDRSGSMSDTAGARQKIHAMRDAADLYTHLLRPETGGSGTGDKIGFVKYNDTNQIYLPLEFVDDPDIPGSHMEEAEGKLSDAALTDAGRLKPVDATGIGGAMETSAGMLVGGASDRKHVMVVLPDADYNQDELDWLRHTTSVGAVLGQPMEIIGPAEIRRLHPFYSLDGVLAALHTPRTVSWIPPVPPSPWPRGRASWGAIVRRNEWVLDVRPLDSGEWKVSSENGDIVCEHVVNAAGIYARQVGEWVRRDLPMVNMTHHYLVTDTVTEFEMLDTELPPVLPWLVDRYRPGSRRG